MNVKWVLDDLRVRSQSLEGALDCLTTRQYDLSEAKQGLTRAKEGFDAAVAGITLEAYGNGTITGKNQAERDIQLRVCLDRHEGWRGQQATLARAEEAMRNAEHALTEAENSYKADYYYLRASLSSAELMAAVLTAQPKGEHNDS